MTLQEFAALKEGDKIENALSNSKGEVVKLSINGVYVVWGPRTAGERQFYYDRAGTIWFHWSSVPNVEGSKA